MKKQPDRLIFTILFIALLITYTTVCACMGSRYQGITDNRYDNQYEIVGGMGGG